jgi:hypothetical protein
MNVVRRTRARESETAATRVVEERATPPAGPPLEPAPDRELWPWLLLLLVLVAGGIVAAILMARDNRGGSSARSTAVTVAHATPTTTPAAAVRRVKVASLIGVPAPTAVKRVRNDGFQPVVVSVFSTKPRESSSRRSPAAARGLQRARPSR